MFHLLAYSLTSGAAAAFSDMTAVVDQDFTQRGGHYIFTEDYNLLAAAIIGATITDARFNVPSINAIARHHFYPPLASATMPTNPSIDDYRSYAQPLPINEEVAIEMSNAAAETDTALLWIGTPDWNRNLPRGIRRLTILATAPAVRVAAAWSAPAALTFEVTLRGGVFAVVGMEVVGVTCLAARLNFPRRKLYNSRKTRPGTVAGQLTTNVPNRLGRDWLGEWGRFHTFEPPQLEVFATTAGAQTQTVLLDLIYLGADMGLLGL